MEPEYGGRNWDYNGADYFLTISDAGIGFTTFCNAAKNCNQRVLDIKSDGGLPYRSIHIGGSVTWDCYLGYMDAVTFCIRYRTFL